jgi:phenylacetate-CoA ligase
VSQSNLHVAAVSCMEARLTRWHGIEPLEEMATLWPNVRGERGRYRTWAAKWLPQPHGRDHRGDGSAPPKQQLRWLASLGGVYLRTRPSIVRALALAVRADPQLKPALKGILTRGEILTDDVRALCARYLGHSPIDSYELTEAGAVALSCPRCDAYHLQNEVCLTEVLGEDGRPCRPGEIGQIVVTPLYNFAMPLIRYATGDFARLPDAADACAFVGLPRIKRVLGRSRNVIRLGGRPPCRPELDSELLWDALGASQWQLAQTGPTDIELRFVSDRPDLALHISEAERHLRLALAMDGRAPPRLKRVTAIPADAEGRKEPIFCAI